MVYHQYASLLVQLVERSYLKLLNVRTTARPSPNQFGFLTSA